jgi:hypothetical protein
VSGAPHDRCESERVRVVVDPRKLTPQEIADAMNAIRAEARRRAGLAP